MTDENEHLPGVHRCLELQVVDGSGGYIGVGMAPCDYTRELVNPAEQLTAEQSSVMVHVSRADEILLLRP